MIRLTLRLLPCCFLVLAPLAALHAQSKPASDANAAAYELFSAGNYQGAADAYAKILKDFPNSRSAINDCEPIYETLPGFGPISKELRNFKDLPSNAKKYVHYLEKILGLKFTLVSLGRSRDETISTSKKSIW